ncbi:MAG: hypothetical protein OXC95_11945 [Dehalococcoidia bacterium]|nr:hypothetical protein [Dehalococcoidia bacterium]
MRVNEYIYYEPDERSPHPLTLGAAFQGVVIVLSNTITIVTTFAVATNAGGSYLSWVVFASLAMGGLVTALQATRIGRLGPGYILMSGPTIAFLSVCVLAVEEGGLPLMSTLVVVSSIVQFAMAIWLAQLRRIITPVVSGVAFMMIAISAMPIAFARLGETPVGASPMAGPAVGAVTVVAAALLTLRASGIIRLMAMPVAIVLGCIVAALFGVYDIQRALDAPWFALPEFAGWPGLSSVLDGDFWALLVVFLVVSAVLAVRTGNEGAVIQQVSWRRPRAIDFRAVQGTLNVGGLGMLLSGIAGLLPVASYLPSTIALINFTGVAARRVGYVVGAALVGLALLPKIVAVLSTIPQSVTGGILMIVMGMLFVEGFRTILQSGLDQHKALIVGLSLSVGVGLQTRNILEGVLGDPWGAALGSSVVAGVLVAVLLSSVLELAGPRRRRFEGDLDIAGLPNIDAFLRELASGMGWNDTSTERLCAAGEETLSTMLQLRDDYEGGKSGRLILIARPAASMVEMEFLAVFEEENIEDRIAFMSDQAETPDVGEISFRLLRHYASSVRHKKYHGIDIVTVQVEA